MANLEKILYIRKNEKKLSREKVGKALGIGQQAYMRREKGEVDFTMSEAVKLSKVLETSKEDLFPEFFL